MGLGRVLWFLIKWRRIIYGTVKTQGFLGGTGGWQKRRQKLAGIFGVGPGSLNEKVSGKGSKQRAEQLERGRIQPPRGLVVRRGSSPADWG